MPEFESIIQARDGMELTWTEEALQDVAKALPGTPVRIAGGYADVGEVVSAHVDSRGVVALLRCPEIGLAPEALVEKEPEDGIDFAVSREAAIPMTKEEIKTVQRDGLVVLPRYEWSAAIAGADLALPDGPREYQSLFQMAMAAVRGRSGDYGAIAVLNLLSWHSAWSHVPTDEQLIDRARAAIRETLDG